MRSRSLLLWVVAAFAVATLFAAPTAHVTHASTSGVVISAIYGGGGDAEGPGGSILSPYTHDYIEIFNAGTTAVTLANWSVQYRDSTSGSGWEKTNIPAGTVLQPGQYYLTQQDPGGDGVGSALPTPDAIGSASMTRAGNFVVALMSTWTSITGDDPRLDPATQANVVDLFGGGHATTELPNTFETAVKTGILDNTTAWFRNNDGCQDTDNNLNDFAAGPVAGQARNTATALNPCTPSSDLVVAVTDAPDPVITGQAITYTVDVDNVGAATANSAVITVGLTGSAYPGTVTALSNNTDCSFTNPTITCNVASIAAAGTFGFTFQVTPTVAGTVTANANVSAAAPEITGNNTGSASTTVSIPTGATGTIDSTATITSGGNVTVTVVDADLSSDGTVTISATGTSGDSETLTLNETATLGTFSGTFTVADAVPTTGNGSLEESDGTLTFTYVDALDAEGDINSNRTDTTTVNAPVPTGATGTIDSTATITSGSDVTVTVVDADLASAGTVSISAVGTSGDSETLTLNETATLGTFSGTFTVANAAAAAGNLALEEPNGTLTFTYVDALDAEGDVNSNRTDTTTVNAPVATGTTGSIDSTDAITSGDSVTVTVVDADLAGAGTVSISAVGTSGDSETLSLTETATAGTFSGTFPVANTAAAAGNLALEEMSGSITFTYVDALDAEGDVNTPLSDTTTVSAPLPTVGAFDLVRPDENQILRATTTTFQWSESAGATSYEVYVSHLSTNTRLGETYSVTKNAVDVCVAGVCSVASTELVANLEQGTYSWTAIAVNGAAEVEASNGPNLFTVDLDGIELVTNGGLEEGTNGWTFSPRAKRKCGAAGDGSDCAFKLLAKTNAQQRGLATILATTDTDLGDVLQVSVAVKTKKANRQRVLMVVVNYVNPTAGAKANGKDKFPLFVEQATTGFQTFSENFVLAGEIQGGRIVVANTLPVGKLFVDDVSVVLMPIGTTPRLDAPTSVDGVLPVPSAPDNFRGNN